MKSTTVALTTVALMAVRGSALASTDATKVAKAAPSSLRGLSSSSSSSLPSSSSLRSLQAPTPTPPSQQLHPGELCYTHPPVDDDTGNGGGVRVAQVDCTPTLIGSCLNEYQCANDYLDAFNAGSNSCGTWAVWMASQPNCDYAYVCCLQQ